MDKSQAKAALKHWGKRVLSNPTAGRVAARMTRRQIEVYERRLPRLWRLYARIPASSMQNWRQGGHQDRLLHSYYSFLAHHVPTLPYQPSISIVVPVYNTRPEFLAQMLESVRLQTYSNWQLCLVDDASTQPHVRDALEAARRADPDRVLVAFSETNAGIAGASNAAIAMATGDFVALVDHDDRLYPNALAEVVRAINLRLADDGRIPDVLYSDERVIGECGELINEAFFKPDWSPLLHLAVNYTTHLSVYRREILEQVGGFRLGFDGAQDHDLMLRVTEQTDVVEHIPHVLYQWRAHSESTAQSLESKPFAAQAGERAVREACARRGTPARVEFEPGTGHYRVDFDLPETPPKVSIVIPTHEAPDVLRACIESIRELTTYPDYELVLVDHRSSEPAALAYLELLKEQGATVLRDEGYFNFGRLCNEGVAAAAGEIVVLLNNDTTVVSPGWLQAMVSLAQIEHVGAVGAKLLYPDGTVQHGGIVGLADVIAGHAGKGRTSDDTVYIHMLNTVHEVLGVTAACLAVRKDVYQKTGGLDEGWVPNAYGDVDLCLRLREHGYTNVYTPYAVLTHHESKTRGLNIEAFERIYMRRRWALQLLNDPYLNPNLSRSEAYDLDRRFVLSEVPPSSFEGLLASVDSVES